MMVAENNRSAKVCSYYNFITCIVNIVSLSINADINSRKSNACLNHKSKFVSTLPLQDMSPWQHATLRDLPDERRLPGQGASIRIEAWKE